MTNKCYVYLMVYPNLNYNIIVQSITDSPKQQWCFGGYSADTHLLYDELVCTLLT